MGIAPNGETTLFTVPAGHKYELTEVKAFNNEAAVTVMRLSCFDSGGLLAHQSITFLPSQGSVQLNSFTVFEEGQELRSQRFNGVSDNQMHLTVTAIDVVI